MEKKTILQFNSGRVYSISAKGEKTIQKDVSFEILEGESLALVGKTGSGKTMIALEIMGLLPEGIKADGASIILGEACLDSLAPKNRAGLLGSEIAYIPQNGMEYLNPYRRVIKQIMDGPSLRGMGKTESKEKAIALLNLVGLDGTFANRYPFQLSGGQCQKVCIAMAAAGACKLLIADEPTNGLDAQSKKNFVNLLDEVFPKAAKIIITHDPELAALCTKEVKLEQSI